MALKFILIFYCLITFLKLEVFGDAANSSVRGAIVEDVYLRFYKGTFDDFVEFPLPQATKLLQVDGFNASRPTVLYTHGYIKTPLNESVQVVVTSYLSARPNTNVVVLDWSNMSNRSYLINGGSNVKKIGLETAKQINNLLKAGLPLDLLHFIGHSLGSHVVGYAAMLLKNNYSTSLKRITGLDPAFPSLYLKGIFSHHISANDADFVDIIHTDGGGQGTIISTGTVDFWVNGRKVIQPGCASYKLTKINDDISCSHSRAWEYYAESVYDGDAFPATPSNSILEILSNPNNKDGFIYMGADCHPNSSGIYYLTTNAESPFGKGLDGINTSNLDKLITIL